MFSVFYDDVITPNLGNYRTDMKCRKITLISLNLFAALPLLNLIHIELLLSSRSLVVRALHRHRKGVGSIPGEGPITA